MKNIFLDFDGTIVNSIKAYCDIYNYFYKDKLNFTPADWTKVNKWNFEDECLLAADKVEDIFASSLFFNELELINDNTLDVLDRLKERFNIVICSIGTPSNIAHKVEWIESVLGIKDMIMISKAKAEMGKSSVDMIDGILIDDHIDNLVTSNADIKICFGEEKEWNKEWKGLRAKNWTELEDILNVIYHNEGDFYASYM